MMTAATTGAITSDGFVGTAANLLDARGFPSRPWQSKEKFEHESVCKPLSVIRLVM